MKDNIKTPQIFWFRCINENMSQKKNLETNKTRLVTPVLMTLLEDIS
jgi:hypothetical protein